MFGGGHVVLPLLRAEVVPRWIGDDAFLAGYGLAQACPARCSPSPPTWERRCAGARGAGRAALLALGAIFLPAFLLVFAALPLWSALRRTAPMRAALDGVNAAVVGSASRRAVRPGIHQRGARPYRLRRGLAAFALLAWWKLPPLWACSCARSGGAAIG